MESLSPPCLMPLFPAVLIPPEWLANLTGEDLRMYQEFQRKRQERRLQHEAEMLRLKAEHQERLRQIKLQIKEPRLPHELELAQLTQSNLHSSLCVSVERCEPLPVTPTAKLPAVEEGTERDFPVCTSERAYHQVPVPDSQRTLVLDSHRTLSQDLGGKPTAFAPPGPVSFVPLRPAAAAITASQSDTPAIRTCNLCGATGHIKFFCPKRERTTVPSPKMASNPDPSPASPSALPVSVSEMLYGSGNLHSAPVDDQIIFCSSAPEADVSLVCSDLATEEDILPQKLLTLTEVRPNHHNPVIPGPEKAGWGVGFPEWAVAEFPSPPVLGTDLGTLVCPSEFSADMQEFPAGLPDHQVRYKPLGKQGDVNPLPAIATVPNATGREVPSDLYVPATDCLLSLSAPVITNEIACVSDNCDRNAVHSLAITGSMASRMNSELTAGIPSDNSDFQAGDTHAKNDISCYANAFDNVVHVCESTLDDAFSVTGSLDSGLSGEVSTFPDISDPQTNVNIDVIYTKGDVYCGLPVQTDTHSTGGNLSSEPAGIPVSSDPREFDFQQLTSDRTRQLAEICSPTSVRILQSDSNLRVLSGQPTKPPAAEVPLRVYRENGNYSSEPIPRVTDTPSESTVHVDLLEAQSDRTQVVLGEYGHLEQEDTGPLSGLIAPTRELADDVKVTPHLSYSQKASLKRTAPPQRNLRKNPGQDTTAHRRDPGTHKPLRQIPYRASPEVQAKVKMKYEEMLQMAVLRKSSSSQATSFCEAYRMPDDIPVTVAYPVTPLGDLLDWLASANYLTIMDWSNGYWQIPTVPEARLESTFTLPLDLNASMRMSFGMMNAQATFPQAWNDLWKSKHGCTVTYPDDIPVFPLTWEQHCDHSSLVLGQLSADNLTVEPDADQIVMTEVQASLGTAGYYRTFAKPWL